MSLTNYHGIWPALLTPLDAEGDLAWDAVDGLVDLFARQGLGGLYVVGSSGQWPLLHLDERKALVERILRAAAGRIKVMVHVGAVSTRDAVELARHARRSGADAVSCVAPIYYAAGPDVVFEHYRRIGAAGELPLFVYHLDGVSQIANPRDYVERLLELPNVAGMKITDRDLYRFGLIHARSAGRLQLFSGADEVLCQAALSGAMGAIGTFYNIWGPACQRARARFVAGDFEAGRSFMLAFQSAIGEILQSGAIWAFIRSAVRLKYGIDVGAPRPPLGAAEQSWQDADVCRLLELVDGAAPATG